VLYSLQPEHFKVRLTELRWYSKKVLYCMCQYQYTSLIHVVVGIFSKQLSQQ
jgi:hypothetical protein